MMFPPRFQNMLEAARSDGLSTLTLGSAGEVDLVNMTFEPAQGKATQSRTRVPLRRCESLWKVCGVRRDDTAKAGYQLNSPSYYDPFVSHFLEEGYQQFLTDAAKHTLIDPSGKYVYCFDHRPSAVNPLLVAMLQWPQGQPRRARVICREGDPQTEPILPTSMEEVAQTLLSAPAGALHAPVVNSLEPRANIEESPANAMQLLETPLDLGSTGYPG